MIELRYIVRGRDDPEKVLQYRQQIDITVRSGLNGELTLSPANMQWSDWKDVPTVSGRKNNEQTN